MSMPIIPHKTVDIHIYDFRPRLVELTILANCYKVYEPTKITESFRAELTKLHKFTTFFRYISLAVAGRGKSFAV